MIARWAEGWRGRGVRTRRTAMLRTLSVERELAKTRRLWEIGKLLTEFDGVEGTVRRTMAILDSIVPLQAAVLMVDEARSPRDITWHHAGVESRRLQTTTERARSGYRYLVAEAGSVIPDFLPPEGDRLSILLPLVVDRGNVFGALHLDCAGVTSEADLALVSAVVHQIAVAIARQRAIDARHVASVEAIRARQEALETVSHDLKNPLGAIAMNADLLARSDGTEDWRRRAIESIRRSAHQTLRLIDDLLDAASIEAGTPFVERARHPVAALLVEAFESQRAASLAKGLHLRYELPEEPLYVLCDRGRIQQVLLNLVANAIKFTRAPGRVTLRACRRGPDVELSVVDEGDGIAEDDRQHVFERHWRGKMSSGTGSGLGLAIARDLVRAHGGRIWVESEVDVGTTFVFTLPIAP